MYQSGGRSSRSRDGRLSVDGANGKQLKSNMQRAEPRLLTPGLDFFVGFAGFPVAFSSRVSLHLLAQEGS